MKSPLRMILKALLFFAIFIVCAFLIPYGWAVDRLTGEMSLDTAINLSRILLGEDYPEPYDLIDSLVKMGLNILVTVVVYWIITKGIKCRKL
ncbi:hypothetical protein C7M52_02882 [Mixta theicola]|nr:hypothetical protein [Mixta theicola]QHM76896.1 hypothetical protein C7M52_02882 [Mixta theicola]